ncbi:MAG: hypothetical protein IPM64_03115 [Phycisphaerales bacterium]|nr:hypothetical protein [Phycisphaerales bacterium]
MRIVTGGWHGAAFALALGLLSGGCSAESTRLAIETQRRANDVQQAVVERQHEALRLLLHRELRARLDSLGPQPLSAAQHDAIAGAWTERDLLEFWLIQQERAAALRLIGVDAKLYADQSAVDLLIKDVLRRSDRASEAAAGLLGATLVVPTDASRTGAAMPEAQVRPR